MGVSRKVLAERLQRLVGEGVLARHAYSERPPRHEYALTEKGEELTEVLMAMTAWGDRWMLTEGGPPVLLRHRACGELTRAEVRCASCREPLHGPDVDVLPGPGAAA